MAEQPNINVRMHSNVCLLFIPTKSMQTHCQKCFGCSIAHWALMTGSRIGHFCSCFFFFKVMVTVGKWKFRATRLGKLNATNKMFLCENSKFTHQWQIYLDKFRTPCPSPSSRSHFLQFHANIRKFGRITPSRKFLILHCTRSNTNLHKSINSLIPHSISFYILTTVLR